LAAIEPYDQKVITLTQMNMIFGLWSNLYNQKAALAKAKRRSNS